ncbi:four-carbon acid sugar kinase family protein [Tropicimonas isoalkanivorans]|uniref:Uncharacterized conserved protein YgbK, DUF1537 family n=1 Tax=Tropicimonas isoalkanivorans TaxID=441112 RepID=A0A1I1HPY2_9RHOB|nr:four-carbon acid sugar kinase family protein [Tropicimonas isoalkanivorans]SFC25931.1 Uncharacterized conserved protein YgbK, DUF1537 family [Tropicimonas isoalkanivorans]
MPKVLILADDVTGALDSSVAFAARGLRAICALAPETLERALDQNADVVAVATNSREGSEQAARDAIASVRDIAAKRFEVLFKKVDSRMKGHIAAEIDALSLPLDRGVVVCPAIPRLKRHVVGGSVCGAGISTPIPVAPAIGRPAQVVDATSQAEILTALPSTLSAPLYVGAAGLAEALAERLAANSAPRPAPSPQSPAVFAIGSRDPVTVAQVEALSGVPKVSAPNGRVPSATIAGTTIIQMTPGDEQRSGKAAGEDFASGVAALLQASAIPTLLGCGGETAAAILKKLGAGFLEVKGELLPGVPLSHTLDGERRLDVITKSGGFGPPDTLLALVQMLSANAQRDHQKA